MIHIETLSTGYLRAQGDGPCEWAQWPADRLPTDDDVFPEASQQFRSELYRIVSADAGETKGGM